MRWLLIVIVALFIALPIDAQYAIVGAMRLFWLTDTGRVILLGLVAGMFGVLIAYNVVWNQAMHTLYLEDMKKAEETYRRRQR